MGNKSTTNARKASAKKKKTWQVRRSKNVFLPFFFCFCQSLRQRSVEAFNRHQSFVGRIKTACDKRHKPIKTGGYGLIVTH